MEKNLKIIIDCVMLVLFILLMSYYVISNEYHEMSACLFFSLFIIFLIINGITYCLRKSILL
ncbi:unknown [Mycoplasma sp. CAG:776]|nr:unknown [Mycoplasma sp. CAG:776]